jgi:hypothetical protein
MASSLYEIFYLNARKQVTAKFDIGSFKFVDEEERLLSFSYTS